MAHDLAVCYRICPKPPKPNVLGLTDKLDVVASGLSSFKRSIGPLRVKLWIILDDCPPEYLKLVKRRLYNVDHDIISGQWRSINGTLLKQIEVLTTQTDAPFCYFAEDDYLFKPGGMAAAHRFMRLHPFVDAISLAYHSDYNRRWVDRINEREYEFEGIVWKRQVASTSSFMIRRDSLIESAPTIRTFVDGNSDLGFWMALTKLRVFNPWVLVRGWGDGRFIPGSMALAWWHCRDQILNGRKLLLFAPQPSLATHMEAGSSALGFRYEE